MIIGDLDLGHSACDISYFSCQNLVIVSISVSLFESNGIGFCCLCKYWHKISFVIHLRFSIFAIEVECNIIALIVSKNIKIYKEKWTNSQVLVYLN